MMFEHLLRIHAESKLNPRVPRCLFAETDLFNEGWLLRGVLAKWHAWNRPSRFPFLPFPANTMVRTSSQLYTPFPKRTKYDDKTGEHNTRADAVAGHFECDKSKSGVRFIKGGSFFAAFEGKMYSGYSPIKNSEYSQLARTASCMVHAASRVPIADESTLYLVTLLPADNNQITPAKYTKEFLECEIKQRVREYESGGKMRPGFEHTLNEIWERFQFYWFSWEEVVAEIADPHLSEFYRLCKRYGKAKADNVIEDLIAAAGGE